MIFGFLKSSTLSPRQLRLQNTPLFRSLKPLEIKFVDGLMHERRYLPDEDSGLLCHAGDSPPALQR